nr:DNA-directed RNA polymerase (EC 2.7.7.6) - Podospora anserina mitochondrion plasmid pAL2-1 [Podospora anserina]
MKKNNTMLYYGCAAQARYASSNHGLLYSPSQAHLFNFSLARTYLNFSNGFRAFSTSTHTSYNQPLMTYDLQDHTMDIEEMKKENLEKSFKSNTYMFKCLTNTINNKPINEKTQMEMEELLNKFTYASFSKKLEANQKNPEIMDYSTTNPKLAAMTTDVRPTLISMINNLQKDYPDYFMAKTFKKSDKNEYYMGLVMKGLTPEEMINSIFFHVLKVLSFHTKKLDKSNSTSDMAFGMGKVLVENFYYNEFIKIKNKLSKEEQKCYYLSNWKKDNKDMVEKTEDNMFQFLLGQKMSNLTKDTDLLDMETVTMAYREKSIVWKPTKKILKVLPEDGTLFVLPKKMPMMVKPKPYTTRVNGGYLSNDLYMNENIVKEKWNLRDNTQILHFNQMFDLVNNLSSMGYKINTDVLDFIETYGSDYFKNELMDPRYSHPLTKKSKLTKKEKMELDSFLAKKETQENMLGLAEMFRNIPEFFMPVNADFRGRVYCTPEYLNYQSTDLAKSLLLFSKPGRMYKKDYIALSYLKMYGGSSFGLDKLSANDRIKWVDKNLNNMKNYRNGKLIKEAKNKFLFLAFCIEYNRYLNCLDNHDVSWFDTYLPIQMDATCNGFQHLSLLSLDSNLSKELNLSESTWDDVPKDFYTFLVVCFIDYLKTETLENKNLTPKESESYNRLINMKIIREIIKKGIMTMPYNVSNFSTINYMREGFELEDNSLEWYIYKNEPSMRLKSLDFTVLGKGLRKVLHEKFHKLDTLTKYLDQVARVCTLLEIPIMWTLPTGLVVRQSYMMRDEVRMKPFNHSNKKFSMKVLNKTQFNNSKQITAFMPNLVHSLDAASLTLLLDFYFKESIDVKNIYTIHDCFAVPANKMECTISLLKLTYIKLYSDDKYLLKLDDDIRKNIRSTQNKGCFNEETLEMTGDSFPDPMKFPDVQKVMGMVPSDFDFNVLKKSSYILN